MTTLSVATQKDSPGHNDQNQRHPLHKSTQMRTAQFVVYNKQDTSPIRALELYYTDYMLYYHLCKTEEE